MVPAYSLMYFSEHIVGLLIRQALKQGEGKAPFVKGIVEEEIPACSNFHFSCLVLIHGQLPVLQVFYNLASPLRLRVGHINLLIFLCLGAWFG